jgi:hypothetical protein
MSQQRSSQRTYTEGDIQLAISNIQSRQIQSERRAVIIYSVPRTTIQDQRARRRSRRDCEPKSKRLTKLEEEVIIQRILEEALRRVPCSKLVVQDIANRLLRDRGSKPVGKN